MVSGETGFATSGEPAAAGRIVTVTALLGDRTRAAMLSVLMGGAAWPAGDLARVVGISPQAASNHLRQLLEGGLVRVVTQSRHRYYSLAGEDVAVALEALAVLENGHAVAKTSRVPAKIRRARSCYDHLAGERGVQVFECLISNGWLRETPDGTLAVPDEAAAGYARLGADLGTLRKARRPLARPCLDWSERRPHLAGSLAAALLSAWLERRWLVRAGGRELRLTAIGQQALEREIGLRIRT